MQGEFRKFFENKEKLKSLIEDDELIFFFKIKNDIFGGNEDSRLGFARIKNPDEDDTDGDFTGIDLKRALNNDKTQKLFTKKDIKKIKIITKEEAEKELNAI